MNKANLKSYAPQARKDFIAAVTARAHLLGLAELGGQLEVAPAQTQGDVTLIAGQPWPAKVNAQRNQLIARMRQGGFAHTVEAIAYTWFNRFAALRYMELHDFLGHGHRALSSAAPGQGALPDLLTHAADLAQTASLPGLKTAKVLEMKLAGNRDGELYRMLLVAQCNALSASMPFLFERIDDDTELLLPDNLLRTDSVIAKLVQEIPEEDWAEVEIIGWLYQFYISEKKDQVIGKVVKSEDIPAATQLFTPNWIVQYLVQNSVGRLWLMANPASALASQWPYYIQPAEQTPEVQAQLDALIQTRMDEDGGSLNPESITVLDPACGSGHILVVAYDVLKAIYLERGYQARAIPRLILEKNLYGLDIDDRAAQMAGFALLMKARADDRRLFNEPPKLNVLSLQESKGLDAAALAQAINAGGTERVDVAQLRWLIDAFEHAKTFGSLIQIGTQPTSDLRELLSIVQQAMQAGDLYAQAAAQDLLPLVQQALVLGMQFDAVVANPPYMGGKSMTTAIKTYAAVEYKFGRADTFAMFMLRCQSLCVKSGRIGLMTPFVWMFLSSYEELRSDLIKNKSLVSLVQPQYHTFFESAAVPICTFIIDNSGLETNGSYYDLTDEYGAEIQAGRLLDAIKNPNVKYFYRRDCRDFIAIPGSPIAYRASPSLRRSFKGNKSLGGTYSAKVGLKTGDNERFIRNWPEVSLNNIGFNESRDSALTSMRKWFPFNKGGDFRKWYGNRQSLVNWQSDGAEIIKWCNYLNTINTPGGVAINRDFYFKPSISCSAITSKTVTYRFYPAGAIFDINFRSFFVENDLSKFYLLGLMNSNVVEYIFRQISPTLALNKDEINKIPMVVVDEVHLNEIVNQLVGISVEDWNANETSWEFIGNPLLHGGQVSLQKAFEKWEGKTQNNIKNMKRLEEENNRIFICAFDLQEELTPEVPEDQITLARADREKDCQRLISYAIGCMMGRYSLDEPGLIYAHSGNVGFDASRYATFPADADGIVPLTDELWFADDAANRVREFLLAVWGADTLEENMAWLAESLGTKASETPDETIRRYLADKFFKDHLQTYKKRPIYWLFSSGRQGAFQALVYLHRYHEGTLARMRAEYVVPLTGKIQSRIEMLQKDAAAASSTAARNKLTKEIEKLKKKHVELLAYDEQLRHYADMRITLDLDDGVKVNYGKFGDLLEGVKAVTGGASDD